MTTEQTVMETLKQELESVLKSNSLFVHDPFYPSMFEVTTNSPKPCHSITLDRDTPVPDAEMEYMGGVVDQYRVEGILITYLEPELPSVGAMLEKYRDAAKAELQDADKTNKWEIITSYKYLESYPMPWTESYGTEPSIVAHRMVIKFLIDYEVR